MQLFDKLNEKYIAALDVGTTTIRCQIINSKAETISQSSTKVKLTYPKVGYVEIEPDQLYEDVIFVIKDAIQKARLEAKTVTCMAIGTQRATFITWRKDDGKALHNFITWKDLRSKDLVDEWNKSGWMKTFRAASYFLYLTTRNARFLAGSNLKLTCTQTTLRLLWAIKNIPNLQKELSESNVQFGTLDTWLLYKLTGGKTYVTDYTNASSTGLFDPFILTWSSWMKPIMGIPIEILPPPVPNDYDFGSTDEAVFGAPIPIKCVMADQQSSMFGTCCFTSDILKVTLGTGCFLDIRTEKPHANANGVYPLVFSSLKDSFSYMVEGACNDCGSLIEWAISISLINDPSNSSEIAKSIETNDGCYFIPAFSGLGPPICDDKAASGFFGVKPTTRKEHMLRAVLESIVFRIVLLYRMLKKDVETAITCISVDGGVSKNDFVCQMIADMTGIRVERAGTSEMGILGLAFIAGINSGVWKDTEHISSLKQVDKVFTPTTDIALKSRYYNELVHWKSIVDRFASWYS